MRKLINNFENFENKDNLKKKTIMNLFICEYGSPHWGECVSIYKSLKFPTSVEISKGHHRGFSFQVLLDSNLEDSKNLANDIINSFPTTPLIVLAEVKVEMKDDPIGWWYDDDLVEPGRFFDKLMRKNKTGIVVYNHKN